MSVYVSAIAYTAGRALIAGRLQIESCGKVRVEESRCLSVEVPDLVECVAGRQASSGMREVSYEARGHAYLLRQGSEGLLSNVSIELELSANSALRGGSQPQTMTSITQTLGHRTSESPLLVRPLVR